jgi:DNA polymerase III epsilon subunit-like protein
MAPSSASPWRGLSIPELQEALKFQSADAPGDSQKRKIFVCIDCEAFELAQEKVTEIGICVLDTADITEENLDLTKADAIDWSKILKSAHFVINEYKDLINSKFVQGHPTKFSFGTSEALPLPQAAEMLERLFQDPTQVENLLGTWIAPEGEPREVILVGHDLRADIDFLKHVKFDIRSAKNVIATADTHRINGKSSQTSVKRLLKTLQFDSVEDLEQQQWLHNAGNDAVWTMKALVAMARVEMMNPGTLRPAIEKTRAAARAVRRAEWRAKRAA